MRVDAECVAARLDFPTSIAFSPDGTLYVAESGLPFDGAPPGGRVWQLGPDGERALLAENLRAPVNGLTWHAGGLLTAEGGTPGRLGRLDPQTRTWSTVLDGLPGGGNYHTNQVAPGPDGKLYFGQGAATNSGIVGPDGNHLAWLRRVPHPHDVPGRDLVLTGLNGRVPARAGATDATVTGAFLPYGTPSAPGQVVRGALPCTAAVMRCEADGSGLELVAWGLRNPYGLRFLDDGRLLAIDLGINDRGSRPFGNVPDCIFEVREGVWYGWPDFAAGRPVTDPVHASLRGNPDAVAGMLLANHADLGSPAEPLVAFPPHAAPTRFAVEPGSGDLIVTLFGDKRPFTAVAGPRAGRALVRVRTTGWTVEPVGDLPLIRPIDLAFHPKTGALHVLDFGEYEMQADGRLSARARTGAVWRVEI